MAFRRAQKVILRAKVQRERWNETRKFFAFFTRFALFFILGSGILYYAHRFLFRSDFFMIRSFKLDPPEGNTARKVSANLSALQGLSMFKVSLKELEARLANDCPEALSFEISRSLPDVIEVKYFLRRPVARLKPAEGQGPERFLDDQGVLYALDPSQISSSLPQVVAGSTESLSTTLDFLLSWREARGSDLVWTSTGSARKIFVDRTGEISLLAGEGTRIVWGNHRREDFAEKFSRFNEVWSDLLAKGIHAQYVNLRDVPQKNSVVLEDRRIVGRVIVRPFFKKAVASAAKWKGPN